MAVTIRRGWGTGASYAVLVVAAALLLLPMLALLAYALWPAAASADSAGLGSSMSTWAPGWGALMKDERLARAAAMTIVYALAVGLISVAFTAAATLGSYLYAPSLGQLLDALCALPFALPASGLAVALLGLYVGGLEQPVNRSVLYVGALVALNFPVTFRAVQATLRTLGVQDLLAASRVLGASDLQLLRRVILPMLWPTLALCMLLVMLAVAAELAIASLVLSPLDTTLQPIFNAMRAASGRETALAISLTFGSAAVLMVLVARVHRRSLHG